MTSYDEAMMSPTYRQLELEHVNITQQLQHGATTTNKWSSRTSASNNSHQLSVISIPATSAADDVDAYPCFNHTCRLVISSSSQSLLKRQLILHWRWTM